MPAVGDIIMVLGSRQQGARGGWDHQESKGKECAVRSIAAVVHRLGRIGTAALGLAAFMHRGMMRRLLFCIHGAGLQIERLQAHCQQK